MIEKARLVRLGVAACMFLGAAASGDTLEEEANRAAAVGFFEQLYNAKNYEAAAEFLGSRVIQHTPSIGDGRDGLRQYAENLRKELPRSSREIKRVLTDRDYVIIQAHLVPEPGALGAVTGDIFRLDEGRVVEHWGVVHPITPSPDPNNPNDVFGTASAPYPAATSSGVERRNLALGIGFYNAALNEKDWDKAKSYIGDRYQQHSVYMDDGAEPFKGLVDRLRREFPENLGEIKQTFADGDMVVLHLHVTRTRDALGWTVIEIMRFENEKVVEHWDIFELVPRESANENGLW